jgi:hypothetical protein
MHIDRLFRRALQVASATAGAAALALCANGLAQAQPVAGAGQLGLSLAALQAAYPSLQRLPHPVVAPRGLRGQWRLTDTLLAGLPFETTFFFSGQRVLRIEQVHVDDAQACAPQQAFAAVVNATGLGYGAGSSGFGPTGVDAFGTSGAADVSAHLRMTGAGCAIRVVYKPTVLKDGSTL